MRKTLIAVCISLGVSATMLGVNTPVKADVGTFDNSTQQRTYSRLPGDPTSYSHKRSLERAPAPAVPDCTGERTHSVPLLTFFFDTEKISDESSPGISLFPCGETQNEETALPGPVIARPEDD